MRSAVEMPRMQGVRSIAQAREPNKQMVTIVLIALTLMAAVSIVLAKSGLERQAAVYASDQRV